MRVSTCAGCVLALALSCGPAAAQFQKFKSFPARSCGTQCGSERWIVKALADEDSARVDFTPEKATVADLLKLVRPTSSKLPIDGRYEPTELKTYTVDAVLAGFKLEDDKDFHLVMADPANAKRTFIAEIPNPACSRVCQSSQLAKMKAVREKFVEKFGPGGAYKKVNVPVTITGVAFFDFRHGQTGVAPNAFELHPVLDIEFR